MNVQVMVDHILLHVNVEDAVTRSIQVPGVAERAQYVRDAVGNLVFQPEDDWSRDTILTVISAAAPVGPLESAFQSVISNTLSDECHRMQLMIHEWVCRAWETIHG